VVTKVSSISLDRPIVEPDGSLTVQSREFFSTITQRSLIIGTGSPEGAVPALQGSVYMDDAGATGAILYIKRDNADGAGDDSNGWILV